MKRFFRTPARTVLMLVIIFGAAELLESCSSNKPGCGNKRQKRSRNKRIKANTTFMTF